MKKASAHNISFHAGQAAYVLEHALCVVNADFDERRYEDKFCRDALENVCSHLHAVKNLLDDIHGRDDKEKGKRK